MEEVESPSIKVKNEEIVVENSNEYSNISYVAPTYTLALLHGTDHSKYDLVAKSEEEFYPPKRKREEVGEENNVEKTLSKIPKKNNFRNNFLKGCKWSPDGTCYLANSDDKCMRLYNL